MEADGAFRSVYRFSGFILECPTAEVRLAFSKIIATVAHCCLQYDGNTVLQIKPKTSFVPPASYGTDEFGVNDAPGNDIALAGEMTNQLILKACLSLLEKEVPEHGRHLAQYFSLFHFYAHQGAEDKLQLLKLEVPYQFMLVAINEGPGPQIKYQYAELGKLYGVVSLLIRSCDVSGLCQSSRHKEARFSSAVLIAF